MNFIFVCVTLTSLKRHRDVKWRVIGTFLTSMEREGPYLSSSTKITKIEGFIAKIWGGGGNHPRWYTCYKTKNTVGRTRRGFNVIPQCNTTSVYWYSRIGLTQMLYYYNTKLRCVSCVRGCDGCVGGGAGVELRYFRIWNFEKFSTDHT